MKIMSSILSLSMIVQGVSGLAFADTSTIPNSETIRVLKNRALTEEMQVLLTRKLVVEGYVKASGNDLLRSTVNQMGTVIFSSVASAIASTALITGGSNHSLKKLGVAAALGAAAGWALDQQFQKVEHQQVSRLDEMNDQEILTEYKMIVDRIVEVDRTIQSGS